MPRNTGPSAKVVRLVRDRDKGACVICGTTENLTTQHRVARGMGGTRAAWINLPANLITLCGSGTTGCHGDIEANPANAREHGWAVARWNDPATEPVLTWRGWLLLDNDGNATPVEAPATTWEFA